MWIWIIMLAAVIGVRFMIPDALGDKKKNLIFLFIAWLVIVFFAGSRCPYLMEGDVTAYFKCYKNALTMGINQMRATYRFEEGYIILNKILAWLFPWEYFIIYFETAFCTAVVFWYFYRNSENIVMSVILYICVGPWSFFLAGFRQGFSICICLIALELLKKMSLGCDLVALGLILLAYSFHTTAIVFLSVFFIRNMKMTKQTVIIGISITVLGLFTAKDLLGWLNDVFERDYVGAYLGNVFGGIVPIAIYTMALIFCYMLVKDNVEGVNDIRIEISILFVGLLIYVLRYKVGIFERISFYFTPVASVVLANAVSLQKNKVNRNIMVVLCLALSTVLFMHRMSQDEYYFFWEYWEGMIPTE